MRSSFGRRRRPKLAVIGSADPGPRHELAYRLTTFGQESCLAIRCWTDREWVALHEAERPADAQRLPGIGWVEIRLVDRETAEDIGDRNRRELERKGPGAGGA